MRLVESFTKIIIPNWNYCDLIKIIINYLGEIECIIYSKETVFNKSLSPACNIIQPNKKHSEISKNDHKFKMY